MKKSIFLLLFFFLFTASGMAASNSVAIFDLTVTGPQALSGESPFNLHGTSGNTTIPKTTDLGDYWTVQIMSATIVEAGTDKESGVTFSIYSKGSLDNDATAWSAVEKNYIVYQLAMDSAVTPDPLTIPRPLGDYARLYLEVCGVTGFNTFAMKMLTNQTTEPVEPGWIATTYSAFSTSGTTAYDASDADLGGLDGAKWVALGPSGDTIYACFNGTDTTPSTSQGQMIKSGGELIIPISQYRKINWAVEGTSNGTLKLDWYNRKPF